MSTNRSTQDAHGVLRDAFDDTTKTLRVDVGAASIQIDSSTDSITVGDGLGNKVTTTALGADVGLDVNVLDGVSAKGLSGGIKISSLAVTSTPTKLTATAFSGRNTLCVRVWGVNTVYFGTNNTVSSSTGYPKMQKEEISIDIKDNVDLYVVCASGQTSELRIIEVA